MKTRDLFLGLAVVGLLSACQNPTDAAKEAKQTAGDAAVFKRQPVDKTPPEQFEIGDPKPAASTPAPQR